jgi:hypothetical protein
MKTISIVVSEESLAVLNQNFPMDPTTQRISLPRIEFASQDKTEDVKNAKTGKKEIKIITEAGTFSISKQGDEENEEGKKIWVSEEIGSEIDVIIIYQRRQLSHWDSGTEQFTSSPIYDSNEEIIPLFCDKAEVERGTSKELQAIPRFQGVTAKGKPTSKLEENKILYVLYKGEAYQMTIRGTSKYAYQAYAKLQNPSSVVTTINSERKENGAIVWNAMTFEKSRPLTQEEVNDVIEKQLDIKSTILAEKAQYADSAVVVGAQRNVDKF